MNPTQNLPTSALADVTPADILRGAALYLERHGWTQGSLFDFTDNTTGTPPACARGAIAIAAYGYPTCQPWDEADRPENRDFTAADNAFDDYIDRTYLMGVTDPDAGLTVVWWNDRDERTAAEVIDALRAAAQEWDDTHGAEADDEWECEGHESLAGEHMGETVYCDGTCRDGAR
jgi:hypothetical protein